MADGKRRRRDTDEAAGAPPRSRSFWSGTISFGLVSIPVDLYSAHRPGRASLRMLSPEGTPLRRRFFSEGRELGGGDMVRGYEVEPGRHVVVTDEELEALEPRRSRDIDLTRFVPVADVDPIYFERGYFLAPAGESTKAYRLLAAVMEETGRAGIATFVMRGKEYLVAILAENGILRAETLRFHDEVRSAEKVGLPQPVEPAAAAVRKAAKAIAALAEDELDTSTLRDTWAESMAKLAAKKLAKGKDVVEVPEEAAAESGEAEIVDLMAILKQSLGGAGRSRAAAGGDEGGGRGGRVTSPRSRRSPRAAPARARRRSRASG